MNEKNEKKERAVELYNNGLNSKDISEKLSVPESTVRAWVMLSQRRKTNEREN